MSRYAMRNPENPHGVPSERHEPKESERAYMSAYRDTLCSVCDKPLGIGPFVGTGDGRGNSFAHQPCYDANALLEKMDADNRQRRIYAENGDALVAALRAIAGETCDHGAGNLCPRDTAVFALKKLEEAK